MDCEHPSSPSHPKVGGARGLLLVAAALCVMAPSPRIATIDSIGVHRLGRELVAERDGAPATRIRIAKNERFLWSGERGIVGMALTEDRALAVSLASSGWREVVLLHGERWIGEPVLGAAVIVAVTQRRILTFHGGVGEWRETRLRPGERLLEHEAGERIGIVVTDQRVLGAATDIADVAAERFEVRERFGTLKVLGAIGTVETNERLLSYDATLGLWSDTEREIR